MSGSGECAAGVSQGYLVPKQDAVIFNMAIKYPESISQTCLCSHIFTSQGWRHL